MSNSYFAPRKEIDAQYRPKGYGLSPGLQRARAPFRTRNAITGLAIGAFVFGVWAYSISAVRQDTFEDLDEEAKGLLAARKQGQGQKVDTEAVRSAMAAAASSVSPADVASLTGQPGMAAAMAASDTPKASSGETRGVLAAAISRRFPSALDPSARTMVWGAPSVDRIGKTGDRGRPT